VNEWLCAAHGAALHTTLRCAAVHGTTRMRWDAAAEWGEWDRVGWAVEPCEREGRVAQRLARGCEGGAAAACSPRREPSRSERFVVVQRSKFGSLAAHAIL
jgi:hypothetical protein